MAVGLIAAVFLLAPPATALAEDGIPALPVTSTDVIGATVAQADAVLASTAAVQVDPQNANVSVRVLSPGNDGAVVQENGANAAVSGVQTGDITPAAARSASSAPPVGGDGAAAGAGSASTQTQPANVNVSVRVLSPGDNGPVIQTNGSTAAASPPVDSPSASSSPPATQYQPEGGNSAPAISDQNPNDAQNVSAEPVPPEKGTWTWTWIWTWDCSGNQTSTTMSSGDITSPNRNWSWIWKWKCGGNAAERRSSSAEAASGEGGGVITDVAAEVAKGVTDVASAVVDEVSSEVGLGELPASLALDALPVFAPEPAATPRSLTGRSLGKAVASSRPLSTSFLKDQRAVRRSGSLADARSAALAAIGGHGAAPRAARGGSGQPAREPARAAAPPPHTPIPSLPQPSIAGVSPAPTSPVPNGLAIAITALAGVALALAAALGRRLRLLLDARPPKRRSSRIERPG